MSDGLICSTRIAKLGVHWRLSWLEFFRQTFCLWLLVGDNQNRDFCTQTKHFPTWVEGRLWACLCVKLAVPFSLFLETGVGGGSNKILYDGYYLFSFSMRRKEPLVYFNHCSSFYHWASPRPGGWPSNPPKNLFAHVAQDVDSAPGGNISSLGSAILPYAVTEWHFFSQYMISSNTTYCWADRHGKVTFSDSSGFLSSQSKPRTFPTISIKERFSGCLKERQHLFVRREVSASLHLSGM